MFTFDRCKPDQLQILEKLHVYLGFNESSSFDEFVEFMFRPVKVYQSFEQVINDNIKFIIEHFWVVCPFYRKNYIKFFWLKEQDMIDHFSVGSKNEYDPKGVVRLFVKEHFKEVSARKEIRV